MGSNLSNDHRRDPLADAATERDAPAVETEGPARPVPLSRSAMVGAADDPLEAAADRAADAALSRLGPVGDVDQHLHGPGCGHLRRSPESSAAGSGPIGFGGGELDERSNQLLESRRGGGDRLPAPVLNRMETAFGRSFSSVRVHDDATSATLARNVSARAFTTGNDIFFGAGQFDPASPGGERVLAHELAHTLQAPHAPGSGVQRLFGFGKKEDPAETARKEAEAAEKKKKKEADKAALAQSKKTAAQNKKLESGEKKHLAGELKLGKAERKKIAEEIVQESAPVTTKDQAGKEYTTGGTSSTSDQLYKQFDKYLELEKQTFADLRGQGLSEEEATDEAYQAVWLSSKIPPALRAVRPPRETAAERLSYEITAARTGQGADDALIEKGKVGGMLSKSVERVYEAWEEEAERLRTGPPAADPRVADLNAGITVWAKASEEVRKNRPTDPRVERQARIDARNRLAYGKKSLQTGKEKGDNLLKTGDVVVGTGAGVTKTVINGASPVVGAGATGTSALMNKLGSAETKSLQTAAGFTSPDRKIYEKTAIGDALYQGRTHQVSLEDKVAKPVSLDTKIGSGFSVCGDILGDIMSSVTGVIDMVTTIRKTMSEPNAINLFELGKSVAARGNTVLNMGKHAAELAKFIDPGVTGAVASVIPGFNIGMAVGSIIQNAMTMGQVSVRLSDVNGSLVGARGRTPGAKKVDVMVHPLLHVHGVFAKQLEQAVASTTSAIVSLITSIATVASGGGYGIPAAIDLGNKIILKLHDAAHVIADQIIVYLAKQARTEGQIVKSEGAAENQLKRDPAQAIDGIIVRARKGDTVAIKFLMTYGVKEADVQNDRLGDTRAKVLEQIGENADPAYIYEGWLAKGKSLLGEGKYFLQKWKETGTLATDRNGQAGADKQRGVGWRLKMMFKGEAKFTRSKTKTKTQQSMEDQIACRVGKVILLKDATDTEIGQFVDSIESLPDGDITFAIGDNRTAPEVQDLLSELLIARMNKAKAGAGA